VQGQLVDLLVAQAVLAELDAELFGLAGPDYRCSAVTSTPSS